MIQRSTRCSLRRTSNEKPAKTNSETPNLSRFLKSIWKNKSPQQEGSRLSDEHLPTTSNPTPRSGYKHYQGDAVTSKTPIRSEDESSDNDDAISSKQDTPSLSDIQSNEWDVVEFTPTDQYTKTNLTKSGWGEVVEFTPTDLDPKGKSTLQKSKSLELNSSQAGRALRTFKVFNSQRLKEKQRPAPNPKNVSKVT